MPNLKTFAAAINVGVFIACMAIGTLMVADVKASEYSYQYNPCFPADDRCIYSGDYGKKCKKSYSDHCKCKQAILYYCGWV